MPDIYASDAKHANGYTPMNPSGEYTLEDAVAVCKLVEPTAAANYYHVALTGGCLYGEGGRKDIDLVFYRIRSSGDERPTNETKPILIDALCRDLKLELVRDYGFVVKFQYGDLKIDTMFPDIHPDENDEHYPGDETMMNDERHVAFVDAKEDDDFAKFDALGVE